MIFSQNLFELQITESTRNTNRIKEHTRNTLICHCLRRSGARTVVYNKDFNEPRDSDFGSYPDSELILII